LKFEFTGFTVHNMPSDGNCLVNSLGWRLRVPPKIHCSYDRLLVADKNDVHVLNVIVSLMTTIDTMVNLKFLTFGVMLVLLQQKL